MGSVCCGDRDCDGKHCKPDEECEPVDFDCPADGDFEDPHLCSTYYKCSGGIATRMCCQQGNQSSSPDSNSPSPPTVNPNPDQVGEPDKDGSTSINDSRRPWKKRYHEVPPQDQPENLEKKRVRVMTKAEKREYQNVENDSSSTGPQSSGGSPPDHEDLASDYSVSPNSEKVDQVNSTEN